MKAALLYRDETCETPDVLVERHAGLVKRIAVHLASRLPPSVQVGDLVQAGLMGLLDATRHYEPAQGASFETYAGIRVRGAMLDEIRRNDWAPRAVRRRAREAAAAVVRVEARVLREARDTEVAAELGISLAEYHAILQDSTAARLTSLDDGDDGDDSPGDRPGDRIAARDGDPERAMGEADLRAELARGIAELPERERMVMSLYYDDELNLKEIGAVLGVTESRVCQLHRQAVVRLRARLSVHGGRSDTNDQS
jgi:RNA polymerase sigma factor for flagellar operon FliA